MNLFAWVPSYISQFQQTVSSYGWSGVLSGKGDVNIFSWPGFNIKKAMGDWKTLEMSDEQRERDFYVKVLIGGTLIFLIVTKWKPR